MMMHYIFLSLTYHARAARKLLSLHAKFICKYLVSDICVLLHETVFKQGNGRYVHMIHTNLDSCNYIGCCHINLFL
jgi:hypothetical protein